MNNNQNNGCGCNCNPKPENIDIQMDVCDRNISMLPMLKTYNTKVLQPNINGCCNKNILEQDMLVCENYKYVIKWDFDLNGKTITVPENCILEFDGGSLSNGTIVGNNTNIAAGVCKIFGDNLTLSGTYNNVEAYAEWFGAKGDGVTDDADAIQKALDFGWDANLTVMLLAKKYLIKKPLIVWCHYVHDYTDNIERSHVKGNGQYNTFIIKDGFVSEGVTVFHQDCAFLLADYRVRTEGLVPDENNCVANALIEDLAISSTSSNLEEPDNDTAIFFIGACFSEFRNISIYGFRRGIASVKYTYGMKFTRIDVHFPHVAFDFGNSPGASGAQTTLYFEGCHTNGCSISDYNLQAAATLVTCAKDGGAGPLVLTRYHTMFYPVFRPRITLIDCHVETPACTEVFKIEATTIHIVGGLYEASLNTTIFSAIKDSLVIVDGATFWSRNETNMETALLYKTEDISRIYFRNNIIDNTLFSTQQILKNQTKLLFDVGVNEIVDYVESGGTTLSHEIVDNVLELSAEDTSQAIIDVYFGQINTSLYNAIRVYVESVDWHDYTSVTVVHCDEVGEGNVPIDLTEEIIGFWADGTRRNANTLVFPDGIAKGQVLGCQLPDSGLKHIFVRMYAHGSIKSSVKIFKVELI